MMKYAFALAAVACATSPAAAAAVITYHQTSDSLRGALSNPLVEDFEDDTLAQGFSITGDGNHVGPTLYQIVRPNRAPSVFSFEEPTYGFGGIIRSGGFGTLALTLTFEDGTTQSLDPLNTSPTAGFYGFSSDIGIRSVAVTTATANNVQFYLDDVVFGEKAVAAVPEPASWAMMIVGFGAVGSSMRRRKAVRVSFV